ncbi:DNA damage-repair/toleration protein DRT100-like [Asparagus officinalis]|uniref:DNA damage-repair/toleration protein DRT100-like n=1 Tax=Asparagus officinalis TaxID=4686 RepID=UPI00098E3557|nr:DNA damage-repair/toleration protein DRT100-like [Asparagus officinalis]
MHFKELFHRFGERFPDLRILRLSSNKFSGQIPSQISNLSSLQVFDFAENDFIGTTLESLGDLKARASSRKINPCNNTSGEFPSNLIKLSGLLVLNLANNFLHGTIPNQISNLHELLSMDLSSNLLSGPIPSSMSSMTFMSFPNLSNNNFLGKIPSTGQFPTFSASSYSRNKFLCGAPLTVQCERSSSREKESRDDTDGAIRDKWLSLSIGLGLAVGLLGLLAVGLIAVVSIKKKHGILLTSSMWIG